MIIVALMVMGGVTQAAFVTIGNPGNAADAATGYGAVSYTYQISATEVTIAEFQASGAGNGNENYWNDGTRTVGTAAPVSQVSLYEAMKYCNYITSGNILLGAYQFDGGGVYQSTDRASAVTTYGTVYALPTEDEWYKAAYFKPDASGYSLYANGTANVPTHGTTDGWNYWNNDYVNGNPNHIWTAGFGGEEQNGTYDMMGNVWEWMEDSGGVIRGGTYYFNESSLRSSARYSISPATDNNAGTVGFRVVAVPEPATAGLLGLSSLLLFVIRRIQKEYGFR
jgi:formylglycine-generating enzyme required for sulfatase activity